jgi:hypothetical protein
MTLWGWGDSGIFVHFSHIPAIADFIPSFVMEITFVFLRSVRSLQCAARWSKFPT